MTLKNVNVLVLDEADRMLDIGFAPQINEILRQVPKDRQTMLFSATMPQEIVKLATAHMKLPLRIEVAPSGTAAEKVEQEVIVVHKAEKMRLLETRIAYANKSIISGQSHKIDKIIGRTQKINENRSHISNIEQSIVQIKETSGILDKSIEEMQQKITAMNEDFKKYAEDRIKLREIEKTQEDIEHKIDGEFSGLGRVMKKFLYYGELTKEESNILQDYIKDSGAAFLSDTSNIISSILDKLYSYRDRNTIDMDESRHEKVKDLIRHIKVLQELRSKHKYLQEEKNKVEAEFEKQTAPIVKEIKFINISISDKQRELGLMKSKTQSMIVEKQMLEKEILASLSSIEFELTELLGRNVRIVA